ncbi:nipped-B protein [Cavenderia fasciculata]|uniref:Sister chromatid cohesion protein n=1 Tax=Cavenderia fasciculata TaxID=261658 RepID=F4PYD6_CACFS|nr:nipped-B protein [Cavenderia fasciculata]EGG19403.1 nipped-B protein [Cavenderia fasciculata]|eukprot:XP_004357674.1 nipped-B protein [Cavenderia fasciculata]
MYPLLHNNNNNNQNINNNNIVNNTLLQQQQQHYITTCSNLGSIGDPIHEIPLPIYRNDRSIDLIQADYAIKQNVLSNAVNTLTSANNNNNNINNSNAILSNINMMIDQTNISYLKFKPSSSSSSKSSDNNENTPPPSSSSSSLMTTIYNHLPATTYTTTTTTQSQTLSTNNNDIKVLPSTSSAFVSSDNEFIDKHFPNNNNNNNNNNNTNNKKVVSTKKKRTTTTKPTLSLIEQQESLINTTLNDNISKRKQKTINHNVSNANLNQTQQNTIDDHHQQQPIIQVSKKITIQEKLVTQIRYLLENIERDKDHETFNSTYIDNLRMDLSIVEKNDEMSLGDIELEHYASLFQHLYRLVKAAKQVHSLSFKETMQQQDILEFNKLELAFASSSLITQLLSLPVIGNLLCELIEDDLVDFVTTCKSLINENIFGHLDPSFKLRHPTSTSSSSSTASTKNGEGKKETDKEESGDDDEEDSDDDDDDYDTDGDSDEKDDNKDESQTEKKKRNTNIKKQKTSKTKSSPVSSKHSKKKGNNYYLSICNRVTEYYSRLTIFLERYTPPNESFANIMMDYTIPSLFISGPIHLVQLYSINLLRVVFQKFPSHRNQIFDQLLSSLPKTLSFKKLNIRTFKLENDKSIQNISALFLQLIQSSAQLPSAKQETITLKSSSLQSYQNFISMIILYFIQKCSIKNPSDEFDYRTILDNFLQDMLLLMNHPDWPAANMVLHFLSGSLCEVLSEQSKVNLGDQVSTLKALSIDILGTIIAKIKQEMLTIQDDIQSLPLLLLEFQQPAATTTTTTTTTTTLTNQHVICQCKQYQPIGSFMVKCNQCKKTYHDLCAPDYSLNDSTHHQQTWICVHCKIYDQISDFIPSATTTTISSDTPPDQKPNKTTKKKSSKSKKEDPIKEDSYNSAIDLPKEDGDLQQQQQQQQQNKYIQVGNDHDVVSQLIINYYLEKEQREPSMTTSKQFTIAYWFDSMKSALSQKEKQYLLSQWDNQQQQQQQQQQGGRRYVMNQELTFKLYRILSTSIKSSIFQVSNQILDKLLKVLDDTSKAARAKTMKSFSLIVEVDPSVLVDEYVDTIKKRFSDDAISVREHTVDLIGKYILVKPESTWKYMDAICQRISDKGISVRKRVIRTLHDICISQSDHPMIPHLCKIMVTRISDDDSIKDVVVQTFKDLWFNDNDSNATAANGYKQKIINKTKQIVEVVKMLNQDDWFVDLIKQLLDENQAKKGKKKQSKKTAQQVMSTCQDICSNVIEILISFDEKKRSKELPEFLALFKCLRIFCKVNPSFLTPFAKLLHPYIKLTKAINNEELKVYINVTYILQKTIPKLENVEKEFIETLEKDLITLISNQGSQLVLSSIKCLCSISQNTSYNYKVVENLFCKSLQSLQDCERKTKGELLRSLYITGLLVRYFDFEKRKYFSILLPESLNFDDGVIEVIIPIVSRIYKLTKDKDIISKSLEAIGNIILSEPSILMFETIKEILSISLSSPEVKINDTVLSVYIKLLKHEGKNKDQLVHETPAKQEDQMSDNDSQEGEGKDRKPIISMNVDIDGESLVASIQKFFIPICKLLTNSDPMVRLKSLTAIELIVHQGIINPLEAVPEIITLITDSNSEISTLAYLTLKKIDEKFSSTLFKRIIESLQICFKFHSSLGTSKSIKQSRTIFIHQIMSQFDGCKSFKYKDLEFYRFVAELLASLPYGNMDELFEIIKQLSLFPAVPVIGRYEKGANPNSNFPRLQNSYGQ